MTTSMGLAEDRPELLGANERYVSRFNKRFRHPQARHMGSRRTVFADEIFLLFWPVACRIGMRPS